MVHSFRANPLSLIDGDASGRIDRGRWDGSREGTIFKFRSRSLRASDHRVLRLTTVSPKQIRFVASFVSWKGKG